MQHSIRDMEMSEMAIHRYEQGRIGNGCGSGLSRVLALVVDIALGLDLSIPCFAHDLEYMEPQKTSRHKIQSDVYLMRNIIKVLPRRKNGEVKFCWIAKIYYTLVLWGGDNRYQNAR